MEKIREILRLAELGISQRQISRMAGASRPVVSEYLKAAEAGNVSYSRAKDMSDTDLAECFKRQKPGRSRIDLGGFEPDFELICREYTTRKGVTLELLWQEWAAKNGNGSCYSYQTFCRRYEQWAGKRKLELRQNYRPGERGFPRPRQKALWLKEQSR